MKKDKRKKRLELPNPAMGATPEARKKLREHRERMICYSKKKFFDEASASAWAMDYAALPHARKNSKDARAYKCPWCVYWHLSTRKDAA